MSHRGGIIDGDRIDRLVAEANRDTSTRTSSPDREIRFLSGGKKQKIGFSRWLDKYRRLFLLLELKRGIDVHTKADIYRIIKDLVERGVGILNLTYDIDELVMLGDRVITMYQGKSVSEYAAPDYEKDRILSDIAGATQPH